MTESIALSKVRGATKFLNEPYMAYGEEKTAVETKKFANAILSEGVNNVLTLYYYLPLLFLCIGIKCLIWIKTNRYRH